MMKKWISILFIGVSTFSFSQTEAELYKQGIELMDAYQSKEAYEVFTKLYEIDANNADYVARLSSSCSRHGVSMPTEAERIKFYEKAEELAKKAITLDDKSAEAHFAYALALGRINENASSKQKIANAKLIKTEAERAIALNPRHAGAYHVLGRYHKTIAGFNAMEKAMINAFFGGVPKGGTYEDAEKAFIMCCKLEPDYILHFYELADTYRLNKKVELAKAVLKKALQIKVTTEEDKKRYKNCQELLEDIS